MPWSDPVITFRLGCAWSMVCVADSPSVGVKQDWPMLTTLIPLLIACWTSVTRPVLTIGCVMMPLYWPELMTVCSWSYCVCGLLFASNTFSVAPSVEATAALRRRHRVAGIDGTAKLL